MPELPEVEVVRRGLADHVLGRVVEQVQVLHDRAVRSQVGDLAELLEGKTLVAARRRGKFLWLELSDGMMLQVHLAMSGQMLVGSPGEVQGPHVRIRALLSGGVELSFVDQRTFGQWQVVPGVPDPHGGGGEHPCIPANVTHIAPDPFEPQFDPALVVTRMKQRGIEIKKVLLDQGVISGIGNIYADEALFLAGIRPRRRASALSKPQLQRLVEAAQAVMARALEAGGTSFDSLYVHVNGASGYFSRSLQVYGRQAQPCRRCGAVIKRVVVGGRSSHYCPQCQH